MTIQQTSRREFTIKGWHVLTGFIVFFGSIVAMNALFVTVAIRTFPGEDVPRSYYQGLQYNDTLTERREQAALGWRASAALTPTADGAALEVRLVDRAGAPLTGAKINGELRRPVESQSNIDLIFIETEPGVYVCPVAALEQGGWDLHATATRGEDALDMTARLAWSHQTSR